MKLRNFIGIDPGTSGAMAVIALDDDGGCAVKVMPFDRNDYVYATTLFWGDDTRCVLERVHAMPKQGVSSSFSFGENFGWIQGVLYANRIPYELVLPQKWKREFGVTADKNTAIEVARRLFPEVSLRRTDRCRKDDDGMAEALLMAEYCRRHS